MATTKGKGSKSIVALGFILALVALALFELRGEPTAPHGSPRVVQLPPESISIAPPASEATRVAGPLATATRPAD